MSHPLRSSGDLIGDRRYAWAQAAFSDGDVEAALDLTRQTLELVPGFAAAWLLLGQAEALRGQGDAAAAAFRQALQLEPQDTLGAGVHLARLLGTASQGTAPAAMSQSYVRALFDDYAGRFDDHLTGALAYRGPQIVVDALREACAERPLAFSVVHDLGCGTGLMGAAIRPHADHLAGCDLSPEMVKRARAKGIYDRLEVADVGDQLAACAPGSVDLILAADVFVYLGDLTPAFQAAQRALRRGGLLAFTVQAPSAPQDAAAAVPVLGEDLRFAHGERYLSSALAQCSFVVDHLAAASTRQDRGAAVPGLVVVARRI